MVFNRLGVHWRLGLGGAASCPGRAAQSSRRPQRGRLMRCRRPCRGGCVGRCRSRPTIPPTPTLPHPPTLPRRTTRPPAATLCHNLKIPRPPTLPTPPFPRRATLGLPGPGCTPNKSIRMGVPPALRALGGPPIRSHMCGGPDRRSPPLPEPASIHTNLCVALGPPSSIDPGYYRSKAGGEPRM